MRPASLLRHLGTALALSLAVPLASCGGDKQPNATTAPAEDLSPVPVPEGHVADLFAPTPEASWTKLRAAVGGPAVFMPQSFGALTAQLVGLPITIAGEIDHALPVLGAVAYKKGQDPLIVIGVHVKAADRFIDQLTKGEAARFLVKAEPAAGLRELQRKQAQPSDPAMALAVIGNYLLVGKSIDNIKALGPYVARTLPTQKAPAEDLVASVSEAALSGPLLDGVRSSWTSMREQAQRAGAPIMPFSGPFDTIVEVLTDAKLARLALSLDESAIHARLTISPRAGGGAAEKAISRLHTGDAKPLLDLPASSQIAVLWRESPEARAAMAPTQGEAIVKMMGEKVPEKDKEKILTAITAEASTRGDFAALGVSLDPTGPSAVVRAPVKSDDDARKAHAAIVELSKLASVKDLLEQQSISISSGKAVVEDLAGDVRRVRFKEVEHDKKKAAKDKAPSAPGGPRSIDLLYLVTHGTLVGAAGEDPRALLRSAVSAPEGEHFGKTPAIAQAIDALGKDLSFALVADPLRVIAAKVGKPAPSTPAPATIALGRDANTKDLWARVDVATIIIQELVKHRDAL